MPTATETAQVARAYLQAWTSGDREAVRDALAEDFMFESKLVSFSGRDVFLQAGQWPSGATTTLVAEAYEGDHGFQLYDATNGEHSVRIAEHLQVRDGRLVRSTIVVDAADFMAFMGG